MAPVKLMTNILPSCYDFIQAEAKKQGKTKRQIIEEAIQLYMREQKKNFLMAEYKRMGEDKEYLEESRKLAEWGMDYYLIDIDNADKQI